jgi:hypothetical protein
MYILEVLERKDLKRPEFVRMIGFCEDRFRDWGWSIGKVIREIVSLSSTVPRCFGGGGGGFLHADDVTEMILAAVSRSGILQANRVSY